MWHKYKFTICKFVYTSPDDKRFMVENSKLKKSCPIVGSYTLFLIITCKRKRDKAKSEPFYNITIRHNVVIAFSVVGYKDYIMDFVSQNSVYLRFFPYLSFLAVLLLRM